MLEAPTYKKAKPIHQKVLRFDYFDNFNTGVNQNRPRGVNWSWYKAGGEKKIGLYRRGPRKRKSSI